MSKNTTFADRIINVSVTGPLVRLEFGTLKPVSVQGQKAELEPAGMLVMPLDGFLASFSGLETVVKKMVADGVVKATPAHQSDAKDAIADTLQ